MQTKKKPVIAYLQTHWDAEWYRSIDKFNVRLVEVFDKVLYGLKKGEIPSFYFDGQVYALLNYLKFRPEKKNEIKKFIKEKKLFIGPFFASIDSFLASREVLYKNLEFGIKISKEFGENEFLGYLSDTFGHSKSIFEILKYFDIKNAILWRGVGDICADFTANDIKTTRLCYGYYQDILHTNHNLDKKAESLAKILDKINKFSKDILLLPLGGDHLAPFDNPVDVIKEINKRLDNYEIKLKSPFDYIRSADFSNKIQEKEFLDNSNTYILPGIYSTRTKEKIENSKMQWNLFNKAFILNYFMKNKYKSELDIATIEVIKNHAHDSIYGCSIDYVSDIVKCRQISVNETVDAVVKNIIRDFKKENLLLESLEKIGVFNVSNYAQSGVLKIITDKKIKNAQKIKEFKFVSDDILSDIYTNPMTEDFHKFYEYLVEVPEIRPFSFKNIKIEKPTKKQIAGCDFIENDFIKIFVENSKIYALDKTSNKLYENFIELHSTKDNGDSYNFAPTEYPRSLKIKASKLKTNGFVKSTLRVNFEENINVDFSLFNKLKYAEIEVSFINKKKNRKLQIVINTDAPIFKTVAQDAIGTIERHHDPKYLLYENMPPKNKEELKTNSYPMQKYVSANGIGVITEGLNEYEIYKNSIKIALLRSIGIISNPKNNARKIPAGPPIECPNMQELGEYKGRLCVTFDNHLDEISENFYNSFVGILGDFKIKNKTYIKMDNKKALLTISKGKPVFLL